MQLTEGEVKVLTVLVGLAGGRPEYVHLAELVRALELPEEDVERELRILNQAGLVWFQTRNGYKHVSPDIDAVSLVRQWSTPRAPKGKRVLAFLTENLKKGIAVGIQGAVVGALGFVLGLLVGQQAC